MSSSSDKTPRHTRITVLISGSGTNLQALIDATNSKTTGPIPTSTSIVRVISNRKSAFGLTRASNANIPTAYHNLVSYKKAHPDSSAEATYSEARAAYDSELAKLVLDDEPDMVVCAGWMHILAPTFLEPLARAGVPVINLHPALPGQFNGARAIERAYEAFQEGTVDKTGIMVHYVISEVDTGQPILVREIALRKEESLEDLETRIHQNEWQVIVEGTGMAIDALWRKRDGMKVV